MIRNNDYALSYNVKDQAIDILKSVRDFDTWNKADKFVTWFNKVVEAKGKITIADICNKMKREYTEPYTRIGFNDFIDANAIYELVRANGSEFYQILFPILRDFTVKEV